MDRQKLHELADQIGYGTPAGLGADAMRQMPCLVSLADPITSTARDMVTTEDKVREGLAALQVWIGDLLAATMPGPTPEQLERSRPFREAPFGELDAQALADIVASGGRGDECTHGHSPFDACSICD